MSLYGSSPFNQSGYLFSAQRGPDGPRGPQGPQGPTGNSGRGPTGPTGYGITYLNFINNIVNTIYTDGKVELSNNVDLVLGNYYIELTGSTSGQFSPLQSTELVENIEQSVQGINITFPIVRRLNFKNLKTTSSPFVTLDYTYTDDDGEPGQVINIDYSVFNLSGIVTGGGPIGSVLINNPGDIQSGLTGTTHSSIQNVTNFGILNAAEQLAVIQKQSFESNTVNVWKIDPTTASVFYLSGFSSISSSSPTHIYGNHICIKKDTTTNSTKGFTIIFPKEFYCSGNNNKLFYSTYDEDSDIVAGNFTTSNFKLTFEPNVAWQSDGHFCPSQDKYDVVNFISIGSRYIGIPAHYNNTVGTSADIETIPSFDCKSENNRLFFDSSFTPRYGLCCKTDCSCELLNDFDCSGYFYEGITCGGTTGMCSKLGACCLYSEDRNTVVPCQELRFCDCYTIASESNFSYKWQPFTTLKKSCSDFNCFNAKNSIGACCDGLGSCQEITGSQCDSINGYYQGDGVNCTTSDNLNVCVSGVGGCCDSGLTCYAGVTGENCLSLSRTYFGDGTTCSDFVCSAGDIPCYSIIENTILSPGTEYDGGIVVGIFNPNQSYCFGPQIFSGEVRDYATLVGTTLAGCSGYNSNYDYSGYGFDQTNVCDSNSDSYLLIISPHPVNIDGDKNIQSGVSNQSKFRWSNGSVAWGPLVNLTNNTVDEFDTNNLYLKEGYIYDSSNESSSKLGLYNNTFLTCDSARFDTISLTHLENRPTQSMVGLWTRNFGLYNTVRLVGSEYFYYNISSSQNGATLTNYTPVSSNITAARALSIYNREYPSSSEGSSNWYIPSVDEMAFIASKCISTTDFNINSRLLEMGYTPLYDWYWTSTGALNVTNNEGVLTPSGITHGSEAWAIKFDADGVVENMVTSRKSRSNEYYVRPVKLIRCDKKYATATDDNFKIWYVPILSESIIDNS